MKLPIPRRAVPGMVALLTDLETRNVQVQILVGGHYFTGRILGGNREVCMFEAQPRPGSPVPRIHVMNLNVTQIQSIEEVPVFNSPLSSVASGPEAVMGPLDMEQFRKGQDPIRRGRP